MSQDYDVICHKCKKIRHLGQGMGGLFSFGFGSKDAQGQADVVQWVGHHISTDCSPVPQGQSQPYHRLEIRHADDTEGVEDYEYIHDEKAPEEAK